VEDGVNGYIAAPAPEEIAASIDKLYQDNIYKQMGEKGYRKIKDMNLSWDNVIDKLIGPMKS
jgi:glycosyltransferase involved in cell wall biosynthesis